MDPSLSNSAMMDLLNATADHDRQGQAARRCDTVKFRTVVEFTSGKGHA